MSNFNVRKLFFKKGKLNPIGALYVFIFSGISIEILIILRKLESDNYILKQLENNIFIYYFSVIGIMSLVVFLFLSARKIPSIISRVTLSQVLLGLIVMLLVGATSTTFYYKNQARKLNEASSIKKNAKEIDIDIKGIGTTEILLATTPTLAPKPVIPTYYVDPDPVISCGPGQNSGQYVKDKRSNCINYVDCELNNNTYSLMLKSECDTRHAEDGKKAYPTCFVFGKTYQVSPETCKYYQQEEARINNIGNTHTAQPSTDTVQQIQQPAVDYGALNQKNIELRALCLASASTSCPSDGEIRSQCRALSLGDNSCQKRINEARGQCSQVRANCESQYPTY